MNNVKALLRNEKIKNPITGKSRITSYNVCYTKLLRSMPLGSFVADSMKEALNTDFAAMNSGGVRKDLEAGTILFKDSYNFV